MTDDTSNPRTRIWHAMQSMEAGYMELAMATARPVVEAARDLPGLDGLVARATDATGRHGHALWPELSLGHVNRERFASLLRTLDAQAEEVTRSDHDDDGRSYLVVRARRHGVWFTAQRDASEES